MLLETNSGNLVQLWCPASSAGTEGALFHSFRSILRHLLALSLRYAIDSGEGISRRSPAPLERFADPVTRSFPGDTARRKRRSPVALSLLRSLRWCLQPRFPLWVTGILVAVEKSGEGVGVEVVPRRFGAAVVYFPRQRVHQRFFYSVARAGLCACCVVARGLWFRRVTGRRASFFALSSMARCFDSRAHPSFLFVGTEGDFSRSLFLICSLVLEDRLMAWSWCSQVVLCDSFSDGTGFTSLKDFRTAFVANPFLVVQCLERHGSGAFEVLGKLFSDGPLSLRADSSGRPKLPGSDSRLNLVRSFAASGWY
ncbi:hypothetical protein DY000_02018505 [Brassica cretica]|uniref:Uncharacterized protein n=1 Tax=Brassica cretica TaxID=69181 RepID=A0ABQ7CRF1_BRACR|nr:hypothetical protein DY000_02018505 [Brassica cretica]